MSERTLICSEQTLQLEHLDSVKMRQVRAGSKRGFAPRFPATFSPENQNGHAKMPKFDSEVFQFYFIIKFIIHLRFKCVQLELHMSN